MKVDNIHQFLALLSREYLALNCFCLMMFLFSPFHFHCICLYIYVYNNINTFAFIQDDKIITAVSNHHKFIIVMPPTKKTKKNIRRLYQNKQTKTRARYEIYRRVKLTNRLRWNVKIESIVYFYSHFDESFISFLRRQHAAFKHIMIYTDWHVILSTQRRFNVINTLNDTPNSVFFFSSLS